MIKGLFYDNKELKEENKEMINIEVNVVVKEMEIIFKNPHEVTLLTNFFHGIILIKTTNGSYL